MPTHPTVDDVVAALAGAFIAMNAEEQQLMRSAYRLLLDGAAVDLGALADAAGWATDDVAARLRSWPGVFLDAAGRLVGLLGMAVEAVSGHQLRTTGRHPVWMWCALDPLFIVPLLGTDAEVSSTCPATGEPIRVAIEATTVTAVPASSVMSLLLPDAPFDAGVRQSFCHFVHFFVSPDAAEGWVVEHPGTFWVPMVDAGEVGRRLAEKAFPAR